MSVPGFYGCDCDKYDPLCQCYPRKDDPEPSTYRIPEDGATIYAGLAFGATRENAYTPDVGFRVVMDDAGMFVLRLVWKPQDGVLETRTLTRDETEAFTFFCTEHLL